MTKGSSSISAICGASDGLRFVAMLYAFVALLIAVGIGILVFSGAFSEAEVQASIPRNFEHLILGGYIASFLTALIMVRLLPSVLNWVTKTEGSWAYIGRSTVAAVATIALYYATDAVASLLISSPTIDPSNLEESFRKAISFSHPITAAIFGAYSMVVVTVVLVMLMSWALVVIPVVFVLLLMLLFRIGEFVALRAAENPKAPQYALSVLLAAVSAAASGLLNS